MDGLTISFLICVLGSFMCFLGFVIAMITWKVPALMDELTGRAKKERVEVIRKMYMDGKGGTGALKRTTTTDRMSYYTGTNAPVYHEQTYNEITERDMAEYKAAYDKRQSDMKQVFADRIRQDPEGVQLDVYEYDETDIGASAVNMAAIERMYRSGQTGSMTPRRPQRVIPDEETPTGYLDTGWGVPENSTWQTDETPTGYIDNQQQGYDSEEIPTGYLGGTPEEAAPTGYLNSGVGNWEPDESPTGYLDGGATGHLAEDTTPTGYINGEAGFTDNYDPMLDDTLNTDTLDRAWDNFESETLPTSLLNNDMYERGYTGGVYAGAPNSAGNYGGSARILVIKEIGSEM